MRCACHVHAVTWYGPINRKGPNMATSPLTSGTGSEDGPWGPTEIWGTRWAPLPVTGGTFTSKTMSEGHQTLVAEVE